MFKIIRWLIDPPASDESPAEVTDGAPSTEAQDDMDWFFPPNDLRSPEPWDRYWSAQLEHGIGPQLHDMFCDDNALLDAIEACRLSTVLCVGSGISQEPHALAAAGLDVTALDISPLAMRFAAGAPAFEPANAGRFFDAKRTRSGGIVKFVVGDLLDTSMCAGPFDVIIERKTLQLFPERERPLAFGAVVNRLSPHGILLSHCHDGRWRPPAPRTHLIQPLLNSAGFQIIGHGSAWPREGRAAFVVLSTG